MTTPTLVAHARGDRVVPVEEGRLLAARIPGARFVLLESANHILLAGRAGVARFVSELRAFLGTEPAPPEPRSTLSPRELEVLELVAAGLTNEAIAERLCLSVRTVERHLSNVYAKLRVSGKAGRAAAAVQLLRDATCRPPRRRPAGCVVAPMPAPASARSVAARSTTPDARAEEARRWSARSSVDATQAGEPIATHEVRGGGGLRLHVREWGDREGPPIVFVHGWSQSQLCWSRQIAGPLAEDFRLVTFDLRGHGMSEKPLDAEHYVDARLWADDLDAVIEQLELDRPVLVAWSYGGFVVTDYLRGLRRGGDRRRQPRRRRGAAHARLRPHRPGPPRERRRRLRARPADEHRRHPALPARLHGASR